MHGLSFPWIKFTVIKTVVIKTELQGKLCGSLCVHTCPYSLAHSACNSSQCHGNSTSCASGTVKPQVLAQYYTLRWCSFVFIVTCLQNLEPAYPEGLVLMRTFSIITLFQATVYKWLHRNWGRREGVSWSPSHASNQVRDSRVSVGFDNLQ